MARMNKTEKMNKNIMYVRQQYERFLKKEFHVNERDLKVKFYSNKELKKKEGLFSKSTFPNQTGDNRYEDVEIDIDLDIIVSGNKKKMLQVAFREALRYGLWKTRKPYFDNHPYFDEKIKEFGLMDYGGVAQTGLDLHMYGCSACKKVYMMKKDKLPYSKDPERKGIHTVCCKAPFQYMGKKYFSNDKLKLIKQQINIE